MKIQNTKSLFSKVSTIKLLLLIICITNVQNLEDDLACSLTKMISSKIKKSFVDFIKENNISMEDFEAKQIYAEMAIENACKGFENYCVHGDKGKRTYSDFNMLMQKGGSIMVEIMGPQVTLEIHVNCR